MVTSSLYQLGSKLFLQDLNGTCAILSRRVCVEDIASAPKHSLEPRLAGSLTPVCLFFELSLVGDDLFLHALFHVNMK